MEGGFLPEREQPPRYASSSSWPPEPAGQRATQAAPPQQPPRGAPPGGGGGGQAGPVDTSEWPEAQGGCSRCTSVSYNSEWHRAYGVVLCNQCKQGEALISKSTAKQRYGVSDGDLSKLGSLRKANPHKKDWQAMHLYMESQVARLASDKHGGEEGLAEYWQAKLDARMQAKLRRREDERQREEKEAARLRRIRQRVEAAAAPAPAAAEASEEEEI